MQDDFPPRHHYDRPPYTPHRFDYAQGDFAGGLKWFNIKLKSTYKNFWLFVPLTTFYYLLWAIFPFVMQTCQVLLPTTIPTRGSLPQGWVVTTLPGVEASTKILARPHMASMAIHPTFVIVSIQFKMILVWCLMYPTLTYQLGSWLHWSK